MKEKALTVERKLLFKDTSSLCKDVGVSRTTYYKWISGTGKPTADNIKKLVDAGISLETALNPAREVDTDNIEKELNIAEKRLEQIKALEEK